ncbi:MAG: hypothetical protein DRP09_16595 [Candidatus Thorarchaeota archaeon]|nr:MAG: hypothetical protein DRP09_16595 [Candidatus Thorarchaeota archaeon]
MPSARKVAGGHVIKKPVVNTITLRQEEDLVGKAIDILDGLYNTLEVAMVDDEPARFAEALKLLHKAKG